MFTSRYLSLKNDKQQYETILSTILNKLTRILSTTEDQKIFAHFIISIPYISSYAFDTVLQLCTGQSQITLGLSTLRDIILYRPPYSDKGLQNLLAFTTDRAEISEAAIRLIVNKLYDKDRFVFILSQFLCYLF